MYFFIVVASKLVIIPISFFRYKGKKVYFYFLIFYNASGAFIR
jgi:hypothetical protein